MSIQNKALEKLFLPIGDLILGSSFMKQLRYLRWLCKQPETFLKELQAQKLNTILDYASSRVPYYSELNIPNEGNLERYLKSFPVLNKQILREQRSTLLSTPEEKLLPQSSSGSSGIQSKVFWTKEEQSIHRATQILWWEWAGYRLGMPILQTGMTPKRGVVKGIKDILLSTYYFPAFVPTEEKLARAFAWAAKKKEVFLGGYASSLYVLSQYAQQTKPKVEFTGAVSWGDKLFDHYRNSIDLTFNTKVLETYGTAEGMMIAAQKDLPYMYIMTPNIYLELLDDDGNEVPDGEIGNVVVTSLVAKGMPLIRYKIGDLAVKLPREEYPINREIALPLLKKVIGRDTDIVKTKSGKSMVVHTFTGIFEHSQEIAQFCVIQENLEGIRILYIPRPGFHFSILNTIKKQIQHYLHEQTFQITFEQVDHIPPTPSGKPQIIISKLK